MASNNTIVSNEITISNKTRKAIELYQQANTLLDNSLQWHKENS